MQDRERYLECRRGQCICHCIACRLTRHTQITSALHRRFPSTFTPALVNILSSVLAVPSRGSLASLGPEQRDKEDTARIVRQRPVLRLCAELAIVGVIRDSPSRSGAEWMMKAIKEMVCKAKLLPCTLLTPFIQLSNDPSLSSLPLLTTFLKSFSYPYLGLLPPSSSKPVITESTPETDPEGNGEFPDLIKAEDELVEQDIRDRFKRMCVGYYENVSRKLVMEHTVSLNLFFPLPICKPHSLSSVCKNKTEGIMRRIFGRARYLKIVNKPTRK